MRVRAEGTGYDPFSGEVQGAQGALRKTDTEGFRRLFWVCLPGVIANDGGLVAPDAIASLWPSQRGDKLAVAATAPAPAPAAAGEDEKPTGWEIAGDPTDVAVLVLGHKLGVDGNINAFRGSFELVSVTRWGHLSSGSRAVTSPVALGAAQVGKVPFDSDYKFMATLQDVDTPVGRKRLVYLKGAWDEVIRRCATQAAGGDAFASEPCNHAFWMDQASGYAANGMRVLAVAQWEVPADKSTLTLEELRDGALATPCLQLNCLVAIVDPCRNTAATAIADVSAPLPSPPRSAPYACTFPRSARHARSASAPASRSR